MISNRPIHMWKHNRSLAASGMAGEVNPTESPTLPWAEATSNNASGSGAEGTKNPNSRVPASKKHTHKKESKAASAMRR